SSPVSPSTSSYPGPSPTSDWSTLRREKSSPLRGPHGKFVSPSSFCGYSSSCSPSDQVTPQRPRGDRHADMAELAKHEAEIEHRTQALKREGFWSMKRLTRLTEPPRPKVHWDYLCEEMQWLSADFAQERRWKRGVARKVVRMVMRHHEELRQKEEKAKRDEHAKIRRVASSIAKEVRAFWSSVEKVVQYKQQSRLEEKRKKALDLQLDFIVGQTEKYSDLLSKSLAPIRPPETVPPTPKNSLPAPADEDGEDFEPPCEEEDDEETIEVEEQQEGNDAESHRREIELLKEEGLLPLDQLLSTLNLPQVPPQTSQDWNEECSDETSSSVEEEDGEFAANEEDAEDEEDTIAAQEKVEENVDHEEELDDLAREGDMSVEELLEKYRGAYASDFEVPSASGSKASSDSELSGEEEEETEEDESDAESNTSSSEESEEEEEEEDCADEGMELLLKEGDNSPPSSSSRPKKEISHIAATAESLQPKGYTLATTKVKFLYVKGQLFESITKKLNGILADEMGLGKTIQTIALLAHLACEKGNWGPHLIIVPTSVMLNWEMELKRWCPGFKILTYFGSQKERKLKRQGWTKPNAFHVCITSYKLVLQDHQAFRRKSWRYLILDEAQNIKNFNHRRLLLTGTPLQNSLMELWSLMHFLMPHVFQSHREFKEWFSNPLTGMIEGSQEYNEGLKQMPKKYEHVVRCRLSKRQRFLYDDFMAQASTRETLASGHFMSVINILMQLRKVCNHPNLFDPRPIQSPFITQPIVFHTASLVQDALEVLPLKRCDLSMFDLIGLEGCVSRYQADIFLPRHKVTRQLIQEIVESPDPPPRPKPVRMKVNRMFQPPPKGDNRPVLLMNKPTCSVTPAAQTPKPPAFTEATSAPSPAPVVHQGTYRLGKTDFTGEVVSIAQLASLAGRPVSSCQGSKPVTFQLQGNKLTLSGAQIHQVPAASARPVQVNPSMVSSPGVVKIVVRQTAGKEGGPVPTLAVAPSPRVAPQASFSQHPHANTAPVRNTAPLQIAQRTAGPATAHYTIAPPGNPSPAPNQSHLPRPVLKVVQPLPSSTEQPGKRTSLDNLRQQRDSRLDFIFRVNERHCGAKPVYGREVLDFLTFLPGPHPGPAAPTSQEEWGPLTKRRFCHSPVNYYAYFRFTFVIPPVEAPPISMHCCHPPPSLSHKQTAFTSMLSAQVAPLTRSLHRIQCNMRTQFPDLRLIQYDCGKLQTLHTLLRKLKTGGHRVLIFTQMTRMLDVLEQFLNYHGHIYLRLDGSTRVEQRQALMERFNADRRIFCFILSTRSGGVGVNLTGADTVVFYDSDWNPTMDAQAQDRCHRIGQTRDVHIYRLISERTVEENILKKANQKRMLGDMAIEGGNFTTAFFKQQTIRELFDMNDGEKREAAVELSVPQAEEEEAVNKQSTTILEQALCRAEDEEDIVAASQAKAEQVAELAEFNENIPLDDGGEQEEVEELSKAEQEIAALVEQLTPIERYAMNFLEASLEDVCKEELKQAEVTPHLKIHPCFNSKLGREEKEGESERRVSESSIESSCPVDHQAKDDDSKDHNAMSPPSTCSRSPRKRQSADGEVLRGLVEDSPSAKVLRKLPGRLVTVVEEKEPKRRRRRGSGTGGGASSEEATVDENTAVFMEEPSKDTTLPSPDNKTKGTNPPQDQDSTPSQSVHPQPVRSYPPYSPPHLSPDMPVLRNLPVRRRLETESRMAAQLGEQQQQHLGRGRGGNQPRKTDIQPGKDATSTSTDPNVNSLVAPLKRKRGRPPKTPPKLPESDNTLTVAPSAQPTTPNEEGKAPLSPKRKRGRPRKDSAIIPETVGDGQSSKSATTTTGVPGKSKTDLSTEPTVPSLQKLETSIDAFITTSQGSHSTKADDMDTKTEVSAPAPNPDQASRATDQPSTPVKDHPAPLVAAPPTNVASSTSASAQFTCSTPATVQSHVSSVSTSATIPITATTTSPPSTSTFTSTPPSIKPSAVVSTASKSSEEPKHSGATTVKTTEPSSAQTSAASTSAATTPSTLSASPTGSTSTPVTTATNTLSTTLSVTSAVTTSANSVSAKSSVGEDLEQTCALSSSTSSSVTVTCSSADSQKVSTTATSPFTVSPEPTSTSAPTTATAVTTVTTSPSNSVPTSMTPPVSTISSSTANTVPSPPPEAATDVTVTEAPTKSVSASITSDQVVTQAQVTTVSAAGTQSATLTQTCSPSPTSASASVTTISQTKTVLAATSPATKAVVVAVGAAPSKENTTSTTPSTKKTVRIPSPVTTSTCATPAPSPTAPTPTSAPEKSVTVAATSDQVSTAKVSVAATTAPTVPPVSPTQTSTVPPLQVQSSASAEVSTPAQMDAPPNTSTSAPSPDKQSLEPAQEAPESDPDSATEMQVDAVEGEAMTSREDDDKTEICKPQSKRRRVESSSETKMWEREGGEEPSTTAPEKEEQKEEAVEQSDDDQKTPVQKRPLSRQSSQESGRSSSPSSGGSTSNLTRHAHHKRTYENRHPTKKRRLDVTSEGGKEEKNDDGEEKPKEGSEREPSATSSRGRRSRSSSSSSDSDDSESRKEHRLTCASKHRLQAQEREKGKKRTRSSDRNTVNNANTSTGGESGSDTSSVRITRKSAGSQPSQDSKASTNSASSPPPEPKVLGKRCSALNAAAKLLAMKGRVDTPGHTPRKEPGAKATGTSPSPSSDRNQKPKSKSVPAFPQTNSVNSTNNKSSGCKPSTANQTSRSASRSTRQCPGSLVPPLEGEYKRCRAEEKERGGRKSSGGKEGEAEVLSSSRGHSACSSMSSDGEGDGGGRSSRSRSSSNSSQRTHSISSQNTEHRESRAASSGSERSSERAKSRDKRERRGQQQEGRQDGRRSQKLSQEATSSSGAEGTPDRVLRSVAALAAVQARSPAASTRSSSGQHRHNKT
uniref:Uncharacterized protein n=1 Tax=Mola mola TaxID=94237 RepID=A0A3Q4ACY0_MOLML